MQNLTLVKTTQSGGFSATETTPYKYDNGVANQADETRSFIEHIKHFMRDENENMLEVIHSKRNEMPFFLRRFFKDKMGRELEKLSIQEMKNFFSRKAEVMALMFSAQKELINLEVKNAIAIRTLKYEKYLREATFEAEAELTAKVVKLKAWLTNAVGAEMENMNEALDRCRDDHLDKYLRREAKARGIENSPFLYQQYMASIRSHSEFVFRVIDNLQERFENSVSLTLDEGEKVFRR